MISIYNRYVNRNGNYRRAEHEYEHYDKPPSSGGNHRDKKPSQGDGDGLNSILSKNGISEFLKKIIPDSIDTSDLLLLVVILLLYIESEDEDFLIMLIVIGISIFKE